MSKNISKKYYKIKQIIKENRGLLSRMAEHLSVNPGSLSITLSWVQQTTLNTKERLTKAINNILWTDYTINYLFEDISKNNYNLQENEVK